MLRRNGAWMRYVAVAAIAGAGMFSLAGPASADPPHDKADKRQSQSNNGNKDRVNDEDQVREVHDTRPADEPVDYSQVPTTDLDPDDPWIISPPTWPVY